MRFTNSLKVSLSNMSQVITNTRYWLQLYDRIKIVFHNKCLISLNYQILCLRCVHKWTELSTLKRNSSYRNSFYFECKWCFDGKVKKIFGCPNMKLRAKSFICQPLRNIKGEKSVFHQLTLTFVNTMTISNTSNLFQPIKVGKAVLQHRVAMAPLTRFRADDKHVPTDLAKIYYEQRASEGGLIITEGT